MSWTAAFGRNKTVNPEEKKSPSKLASESIDVTLPGRPVASGYRHILTQTSEEIEDIFIGQLLSDGSKWSTTTTLERMNLPKTYPARGYAGYLLYHRWRHENAKGFTINAKTFFLIQRRTKEGYTNPTRSR